MRFNFFSYIWNYIKQKFKRNEEESYIELKPMVVKQRKYLYKYTLLECQDEYGFFIYFD